MGVVGLDVLKEFDYPEIYSPVDLSIGKCRLSLARLKNMKKNKNYEQNWDLIKIASKYPKIAKKHFAKKGLSVNCIKMNGSIELAPSLGLAENIVDLVSTGKTLAANGLEEVERILDISSRLVVNRTAFKTRTNQVSEIILRFQEALNVKNT